FECPLIEGPETRTAWMVTATDEDAEKLGFMVLDYNEERQLGGNIEPDVRIAFDLAQRLVGMELTMRGSQLALRRKVSASVRETIFDVFLSYHSEDRGLVRRLADELGLLGIRVWLDEREVVPGHAWHEALEEIIRTVK